MSTYTPSFLVDAAKSEGDTLETAVFFCGIGATGAVFGDFASEAYEDTLTDNT